MVRLRNSEKPERKWTQPRKSDREKRTSAVIPQAKAIHSSEADKTHPKQLFQWIVTNSLTSI